VAVRVTDAVGLPPVAAGDLTLALLWFVLGFSLYAFLFASTSALVDKITRGGLGGPAGDGGADRQLPARRHRRDREP
ncbi:hypothetical protein, partial [Salmonella enterica]|uniref:hypothetical protein n=1 Tax=Salmonella enterica TaxID=28901 RepID=UPI00329A6D35